MVSLWGFSSPPQKGGGDRQGFFSPILGAKFLDRAFRKFTLIVLESIFDSQIVGSGNFLPFSKLGVCCGTSGYAPNLGVFSFCLPLRKGSDRGCFLPRIFFILTFFFSILIFESFFKRGKADGSSASTCTPGLRGGAGARRDRRRERRRCRFHPQTVTPQVDDPREFSRHRFDESPIELTSPFSLQGARRLGSCSNPSGVLTANSFLPRLPSARAVWLVYKQSTKKEEAGKLPLCAMGLLPSRC